MEEETNLFGAAVPDAREREEVSALDQMIAASRRYHNSRDYMEMLQFISRFPKYAPFNCFLLHIQNPAVSYVAPAATWLAHFGRHPKPEARPMVILAPRTPVLFVYDLTDTEGAPVPEGLLRPFETKGELSQWVYDNTVSNCGHHGIGVRDTMMAHGQAGGILRLDDQARESFAYLGLEQWVRYLVLLNREHTLEDQYSSLAHELAHLYCGHLGAEGEDWWQDRQGQARANREVEAESIAYLVCRRKGLHASSERYLAGYRTDEGREIPPVSLSAILMAATYIEGMGLSRWRGPKKRKREKPERQQRARPGRKRGPTDGSGS